MSCNLMTYIILYTLHETEFDLVSIIIEIPPNVY